MYTPTAILSIRAMQHLLREGWPNKGLLVEKQEQFLKIQTTFRAEMDRDMNFRDIQYVGV